MLDRRKLLRCTAAACASALPVAAQQRVIAGEDLAGLTIVDAHTHFYDPRRPQGVPWPAKNNALLYRPVLPADFLKVAGPHGIAKTIVVEASPWVEDNQWILDLASREPSIVGFVGHLTPGDEAFAKQLNHFASNALFRGIRVDSRALATGLEDSGYRRDLARLVDHDLELDVNGGPSLLAVVARLAREIPELRIVINHVANLPYRGGEPDADWQAGMLAAAGGKLVFCKVSALVEGAAGPGEDAPRDVGYYRPVLDVVWRAFGEDRLIYGSNWPVSDRAAPYATVFTIVRDYFATKGPSASAKFFSANARTAYKWVDR